MSTLRATVVNTTSQRLVVFRKVTSHGSFGVEPSDLEPESTIQFTADESITYGSQGSVTWLVDGTQNGVHIDWDLPIVGFDTRHELGDQAFAVSHALDGDRTVWTISARPIQVVDDPCPERLVDPRRAAPFTTLLDRQRIDVVCRIDSHGLRGEASGSLVKSPVVPMAGPPLWSGDLTACENGAAATWGLSISRGAFMNPGGGAFNIALSVTTAGRRVLVDTVEAVELGNNLFSAASPDVRISVATMAPPEIG